MMISGKVIYHYYSSKVFSDKILRSSPKKYLIIILVLKFDM